MQNMNVHTLSLYWNKELHWNVTQADIKRQRNIVMFYNIGKITNGIIRDTAENKYLEKLFTIYKVQFELKFFYYKTIISITFKIITHFKQEKFIVKTYLN